MSQAARNATRLSVSLVIPVKDEAAHIEELLQSIGEQSYPPDEIIVIDGGSRDDTVAKIRQASEADARIKLIEAGQAYPGIGRNIGIAAAQHEWIALTDAGIRLEPDWLLKLVEEVYRDEAVRVVYGNFEPLIESFLERCAALAYVYPRQQRQGRWIRAPFIASSLLRKSVWQKVGGFPNFRAAEDMIFMHKLEQAGCQIAFAPEATAWWRLRPTVETTFAKFVLYSKHNVWAGWQRYWHYGIARNYLLTLPFLAVAILHSWWWLTVPASGIFLRVAKSIWDRRELSVNLLNPLQFLGVAGMIFVVDMATFIGWVMAIVGKEKPEEPSTKKQSAENSSPQSALLTTLVSLVIPVKDEESTIENLLQSIHRQTYAPDEIVIVDGGSRDRTIEMVKQAQALDKRIKLIEAGKATPGKGRNTGIAAAQNEWVALTDAGIKLETTWLERLVRTAEREPTAEVVYGNFEPLLETFFEQCAALVYLSLKVKRGAAWMRDSSVVSMLLRRRVWEEVGGFPDLRAAEDRIFMTRIEERGYKIAWSPEATAWWKLRPNLASTFQKFLLYSKVNVQAGWQRYWHYAVARKYLLGLPFILLAIFHQWWWILVPLAGTMARIAKSIWERREGRGLFWLLNPVQFMMVGIILLTIDAATFIGWGQALLERNSSNRVASSAGDMGNTR